MDSPKYISQEFHDPFLEGNDVIEKAIADYYSDTSNEKRITKMRKQIFSKLRKQIISTVIALLMLLR